MTVTLADIVQALGGELHGDPSLGIKRIAALAAARRDDITFMAQARLRAQLDASQATCVIVSAEHLALAQARGAAIVTDDPYAYYAALTRWWVQQHRVPVPPGVHPSAVVSPGATVATTATIDALAVVEDGAVVGDHARVGAHTFVGAGARVGSHTVLHARVTLGARCVVGERGIVHSGAVIGADGFGFAPAGQGASRRWHKIEQLGRVVVGDDVEIGANTCIDRGALGDTVVGDGVKLDNLIQVGHNVRIGAHTAIAGCTGIAGSTTIGAHCMIAGAANIIGHLTIADGVTISVATVVTRSIRQPGTYSGSFPFDDNAQWERNAATLRNLHALRERVRDLEKRLGRLATEPAAPSTDTNQQRTSS
jgi:UDP-3-O-[3-hydroxymyristoyl] glucosamine N-acyltransferase